MIINQLNIQIYLQILNTGNLEKLEQLHLDENKSLHNLPHELGMCLKLYSLTVEGCPMTWMPQEVLNQGPQVLIDYLTMRGGYNLKKEAQGRSPTPTPIPIPGGGGGPSTSLAGTLAVPK